jgi:hypothetical protein
MSMRSLALSAALLLSVVNLSEPARADAGDALIGGLAGFAVGTIFGNATAQPRYYRAPRVYYVEPPPPIVYEPVAVYYAPPPWTPEWYSYCARKYRSFDARSGTFVGFDGYRHLCE